MDGRTEDSEHIFSQMLQCLPKACANSFRVEAAQLSRDSGAPEIASGDLLKKNPNMCLVLPW